MFAPNIPTVPEFFKGKSVFITGATGFLGKLLLEKLLRSCPDIKNIYVLIRPKKSMSVAERLEKLKSECVFSLLKESNATALDKIIPISGDCSELRLGISDEDRAVLVKNVSIIINGAASVRFNDFLQHAIFTNVRSAREIIELAEDLNNIDCFLHISTAYSNCDIKYIEERLYSPKYDWREAIKIAEIMQKERKQREVVDYLTQKFINPMPNTYVFTKALAENAVQDLCTNKFPTSILRPSIVIPTINEPIKGYTDNWNGPISMYLAGACGISKVMLINENHRNDYVFADNIVKATILAAWQTAMRKNLSEIKVYNGTSDCNHSPQEGIRTATKNLQTNPMKYYIGPPNVTFTTSFFMYAIWNILFHLLPAIIIDIILKMMGQTVRILTIRRKFVIANLSLVPFIMPKNGIGWTFVTENYENLDKSLLESDRNAFAYLHNRGNSVEQINNNFKLYLAHTRVYLVPNERLYASEAEILRYKRIKLMFKIVKNAFWTFLGYLIFWKYSLLTVLWIKMVNYVEAL